MPNITHAKIYDYTTGTVVYLTPDDMLPIGEAGSDSILVLTGCNTVNDWYNLLEGNFKLTYRAANGNIIILDEREVITAEDVHALKSHSAPMLQWFQPFVWNIYYDHDIERKKDTTFTYEVKDSSIYDVKAGKARNSLMQLVSKDILPATFVKELFVGGVVQSARTQSENREAIFDAITSINKRTKGGYGQVIYEILHTQIKLTISLQGYI